MNSTLFYIVQQLPVNEKLFEPQSGLPFAAPRQSYLNFGPLALDESDIDRSQALLVVEFDTLYNRVDHFKDMDQVVKSTQ